MGQLAYKMTVQKWDVADPGTALALPHSLGRAAIPLVLGAGAETNTLPIPTKAFQELLIYVRTAGGGTRTVTVASAYDEAGSTTIALTSAGAFAKLVSVETAVGTFAWRVDSYDNVVGPSVSLASLTVTSGTITTLATTTITNTTFTGSAGRFTASLAIGGALPTNPQAQLSLAPAANAAGVTANQSYYHATVLPGGAVTIPTGTAPIVASVNIAEPNITATGTVTVACTLRIVDAPTEGSTNHALWIDAGTSRFDGNFNFAASAHDDVIIANTAAAYQITDATTALLSIDSRNTVTVINHTIQGPAAQTLPNGATSRNRTVSIAAKTVTLLGTTQVTTVNQGTQMHIGAPTYAQSGGAVTVDQVSTLHVGTVVAGASVTISANYIISTDTAGCFCTAAGTWTDTSGEKHKKDFADADMKDVLDVVARTDIKRFRYKDASDGNILRFGGIAERVPEELSMPGREGIASRDVAWLALAGVKALKKQIEELQAAAA